MPDPTLLGDVIQPAWQALTPEQRTCWHFWAQQNPVYDEDGTLTTLYGQQAHYRTNANVAVLETPPLIEEPPANTTPPDPISITAQAWPLQSLTSGGTTARRGLAFLTLAEAIPSTVGVIVRQGYDRKKTGRGRPPRTRHVTVAQPGDAADIDPTTPGGYFASTAGDNRFATIKGITAQRRPDKPFCTVRVVDLETGAILRQTVANPYGGARTGANRARATAIDPTTGINHYP